MWFRRKAKVIPVDAVRDLRDRALSVQPAELGFVPTTERPHVWDVLMETGYPEAAATLVALEGGTVGLYFSSGPPHSPWQEEAATRTPEDSSCSPSLSRTAGGTLFVGFNLTQVHGNSTIAPDRLRIGRSVARVCPIRCASGTASGVRASQVGGQEGTRRE